MSHDSAIDLLKHRIVSYGDSTNVPFPGTNWLTNMLAKLDINFQPVFSINNIVGMIRAVESGIGIAALPDYMTVGVPNIIRVLPQVEGPKTEAHFVYPQSLKNVARVVAFRNFLYSKIRKWEF